MKPFRKVILSKYSISVVINRLLFQLGDNQDSLWDELRLSINQDPKKLIVNITIMHYTYGEIFFFKVIDDHLTGSQTVYNVNVLLDYSVDNIAEQLQKDEKLFFILSNSRSLENDKASNVLQLIVENINKVNQ